MESSKASRRRATAAGGVVALAAGLGFYWFFITPLTQQEMEARRIVSDLRGRIERVRNIAREDRAVEQSAGDLPMGLAIISAPALIREHFARFGIAVSVIRLNTTQDEPDIPGYQRGFWSVALPIDAAGRNLVPMLRGVADLDQQNSLVRILDFAIRPDPVNPGGRVGLLNLAALIRK